MQVSVHLGLTNQAWWGALPWTYAGVHGFWWPYRNIFSLVHNDLGLDPFTDWTKSAQYSPNGLEVTSPIFQDLPRLPTPMGTFLYPKFQRLPLSDRLTALPLMYNLLDFDNSDDAWRRYDKVNPVPRVCLPACRPVGLASPTVRRGINWPWVWLL